MGDDRRMKITVNIPFPNERHAEIAYDVLRVDLEPKRGGVTKTLTLNKKTLKAEFDAELLRQLRVSVNGFFENLKLIAETFEFCGEPVSETYDHFV